MDKLMGKADAPVKYSSVQTRYQSLDWIRGDVQLDDNVMPAPVINSYHVAEDLAAKFKSGVYASDLPSAFGPIRVDRQIGDMNTNLDDEIKGYMRRNGLPNP